MALTLASKAPGAVIRYGWAVPVIGSDSPQTASLTVTTGTAVIDSYQIVGDTLAFVLSGGTLGETTIISASVGTSQGETLIETIYVPIRTASNAFAYTVRDICNKALRKIVGMGGTATADELNDAAERLSDLLAGWAADGADLGVVLPCDANDTIFIPDYAVEGVKASLELALYDFYGEAATASLAMAARKGVSRIKYRLASQEPIEAVYY